MVRVALASARHWVQNYDGHRVQTVDNTCRVKNRSNLRLFDTHHFFLLPEVCLIRCAFTCFLILVFRRSFCASFAAFFAWTKGILYLASMEGRKGSTGVRCSQGTTDFGL